MISPDDILTPMETEQTPQEPLPRKPIPLREAVGLYLLGLGLMLSAGLLLQTADLRIGLIVTEGGLILLPTLYFVQRNRRSFRRVLSLNRVSAPVLLVVLALTVPLRICTFLISAVVQTFLPMPDFILSSLKSIYAELMFFSTPLEMILSFMAIVVMAGVCEEVMFRGFILHTFLNRKGRWFSIIITGLGFALYHLDPWAFPEITIIGIFLGWLVLRTGSIFPAIVAHASFNFLGIFALPRVFGVQTIEDFLNISFPPYLYPIAFVIFIILLYLFIRMTSVKTAPIGVDVQAPAMM